MTNIDYTNIFHTVPLSSQTLQRLPDGTKTNPGFPDNWVQYQSKRNTRNTPVLGAIARQDFIGIDIDNSPLFKQALEADNDTAEYVAESDLKGGHLLYSFNESDYQQLKTISKLAKASNVDIQIDNKLIYLATEANTTKKLLTEPLTSLPATRIPQNVINLIFAHAMRYQIANPHIKQSSAQVNSEYNSNLLDNSTLGYLLEKQEYTLDDLPTILPQSLETKNPKDLKMGEGTDWMNSVRFKLSQDPSVSENDFIRFMLYLNTLWDNPMEDSRVIRDCKYDINNGLNKLTDTPLWRYNTEWKQEGFKYSNRNKHIVEIMFDSSLGMYVEHNKVSDMVVTYDTATKILDRVLSNSFERQKIDKPKLLKRAEGIILVNTPEIVRGKSKGDYGNILFNDFKPSEGAKILAGTVVVKNPRRPTNILKFFEHIISDPDNRLRMMQFIACKHTTYEHSSLYFVFAGVGGAGKGVFIETILQYFSGSSRMPSLDLEDLLCNFNDWKSKTDYAMIDEAGEGNSKNQMASMVGELKKITGSPMVNITRKGKDTGDSQRHYITPVLSTNMNTKLITDTSGNDRRLVFFKCPNRLSKISNDDDGAFIAKMIYELPHFATYLKTLEPIKGNDYRDNRNWKNKDYEDYIQITISPIDKLVEAAETKNMSALLEVLTEDLSLSKSTIDSMFRASKTDGEIRMLIYNTTGTLELNMKSLCEAVEEIPNVDPDEIKRRLKSIKAKLPYAENGNNYTLQVIKIPGTYKTLINQPNIEEISL